MHRLIEPDRLRPPEDRAAERGSRRFPSRFAACQGRPARTGGIRTDGIRTDGIRTIPPLVIDSAHNVDSTRRLCQTLDDYFPARPVTLVLGVSGDKDVRGILAELRPRITGFIATTSTHPRAMPPEKLATLANESGLRAIPVTAIENALHLAIENTPPNGLVLVTGSIFVAGAARTAWERNPY